MVVFKPDHETTKCCIAFLSNLSENHPNQPITISHNQAIHAGSSLNKKNSSALIHLRFMERFVVLILRKLLTYISLNEVDQNRIRFLWFRNSIVAYKKVKT